MVVSCCAYECKERFVIGGRYTFHCFPKDKERRRLWEIKTRRKNFHATNSTRICSKHFTDDCFNKEKFGGTWLKPGAVPTLFDFPSHLVPKISPPRKPPTARVSSAAVRKTREPAVAKVQESAVEKVQESAVEKIQEPAVEKFQEPAVEKIQEPAVEKIQEPAVEKNKELSISKSKKISNVSERPTKRRLIFIGDFTEEDMLSPINSQKLFQVAKRQSDETRKKIKFLNQNRYMLEKQVTSLKFILHELKKKRESLITDSASNVFESDNESVIEETSLDEVSLSETSTSACSHYSFTIKKPKKESVDQANHTLKLAAEKLQLIDDEEYCTFGKYVTEELRCLPIDMALYCQKIINEAIFEGEMGTLNRSSRIVTLAENQFPSTSETYVLNYPQE